MLSHLAYAKWKIRHDLHKRLCPYPWTERGMFLVELCMKKRLRVERVAEIGVWRGHTSQVLLHFLPGIRSYHLVDPWANYADYEKSGDAKANEAIALARDLCAERLDPFRNKLVWHAMYSHEAAGRVEPGSLDLVFIDGNHDYDYVKRDIACWLPKLRRGGILAGHDLDWKDAPGVRRAVEESFGSDWSAGPDMVWWRIHDGG